MAEQDPRPITNYPKPKVEKPFGCFGVMAEGVLQLAVGGAIAAGTAVKGPVGWLLAALVIVGGLLCLVFLHWLRDQTHW